MGNLFSSFDPMIFSHLVRFSFNWVSRLGILLIFPQLFWVQKSQISKSFERVYIFLRSELSAVFGQAGLPGNVFVYSRIFFFIVFSNAMGLFPYIFTSSSHLSFTLTLALPLWLGRMVWAILHQYNDIIAHLVPQGTPNALIPVIVIIETVRNIIRPGTLGVRLAANMIAGHLLLALLGSQDTGGSFLTFRILIGGLILLMVLELAVACIQAYVFTILRSLYLNELRSKYLNKEVQLKIN